MALAVDDDDPWLPIAAHPGDMACCFVFVPGSRIGDFQEEADMIHVAFLKNGGFHLQDEDHFIVSPSHYMPFPKNPKQYRPK